MKSENQNRSIYDLLRDVPKEARKPITDGRLKGKTDVNAMWRIKRMTEIFGPCGFGWKYVIKSKELQTADGGNISAFVDIDLYVKHPETGEWSEPIPGTGGNIFQRIERSGNVYMDDDCVLDLLHQKDQIAIRDEMIHKMQKVLHAVEEHVDLDVETEVAKAYEEQYGKLYLIRMRHENGWGLNSDEIDWLLDHVEE